MSMQMPPDYASGLPTPPGGGDPTMGGPAPPMDGLNGGGLPSQDGMAGLMAALGGGADQGGGPPPDPSQGDNTTPDTSNPNLDAVGHIQEAMKHLMMAMAMTPDEQHGLGITKGMGALQGILAGEAKKQDQLSQLGAGPGAGPSGG